MAKPRIHTNENGSIDKYVFPHYMNSITPRDPLYVAKFFGEGELLRDCVVLGADGSARDAVLDRRGNVGDFDRPPVCDERALFAQTPILPTIPSCHAQVEIGYMNIFGPGVVFEGLGDPESTKYKRLCRVGDKCVIGAGVHLSASSGFRVADGCVIGAGTLVRGHLEMDALSGIGDGCVFRHGSVVVLCRGSSIGSYSEIAASRVEIESGASLPQGTNIARDQNLVVTTHSRVLL